MKLLNINEEVEVALTWVGKDAYKRHVMTVYGEYGEVMYEKMLETGKLKTQLWQLMNIFGGELRNGVDILFEKNNLRISDDSLREER